MDLLTCVLSIKYLPFVGADSLVFSVLISDSGAQKQS